MYVCLYFIPETSKVLTDHEHILFSSAQFLLPKDNVSLCRPGSPGTQTLLEFIDLPASASHRTLSQTLYWLTLLCSTSLSLHRPGDMLCHGHCKLSYRESRFYYFSMFIYLVWTRVTNFVGPIALRSDLLTPAESTNLPSRILTTAMLPSNLFFSFLHHESPACSRVSGCGDYLSRSRL